MPDVCEFSGIYGADFCSGLRNFTSIKNVHGERNGTPLQYSCLENPMDGGAW